MEKPNLIKQLNRASRRFLLGLALVLVGAPFSIVPLLIKLGVRERPQEYPEFLWNMTPVINSNNFAILNLSKNELLLIAGFGILLMGIFVAYAAHKEWDKLEKIRFDADKKILIDDYALKKTAQKK